MIKLNISDRKVYLNAKRHSYEYINNIINEYLQDCTGNAVIYDCWEYLNDIMFFNKEDFISSLNDEERSIIQKITFERFVGNIQSIETFVYYLLHNDFEDKFNQLKSLNNS